MQNSLGIERQYHPDFKSNHLLWCLNCGFIANLGLFFWVSQSAMLSPPVRDCLLAGRERLQDYLKRDSMEHEIMDSNIL